MGYPGDMVNKNYWGNATHFRVPSQTIREIEEHVAAGRKIQPIRILRDVAGCSLAEGKAVVDRIAGLEPNGPRLLPNFDIKSITLSGLDGDVVVDLEGMQLMGLMNIPSLGIDECRRILDLVDRLRDWQTGPGKASD